MFPQTKWGKIRTVTHQSCYRTSNKLETNDK